jgi:chemotaxis signal transduction protein
MDEWFVLVRAGDLRQLVRLGGVREIVAMMALEPLPGCSGRCRGVANVRGEIVPVFDLAGPEAPLRPDRFILVSPTESSVLGIAVDDVLEVLAVPRERVERREIGPQRTVELVRIDRDLYPVLDPHDVVGAA